MRTFLLYLSEKTPAIGIHKVDTKIDINELVARNIALPVIIVIHHIKANPTTDDPKREIN